MAANKAEAKKRLADLKERYQHLLQVQQSMNSWLQGPRSCAVTRTAVHVNGKIEFEVSAGSMYAARGVPGGHVLA